MLWSAAEHSRGERRDADSEVSHEKEGRGRAKDDLSDDAKLISNKTLHSSLKLNRSIWLALDWGKEIPKSNESIRPEGEKN